MQESALSEYVWRLVKSNDEVKLLEFINATNFDPLHCAWKEPKTGLTALHVACVNGNEKMVQLLLHVGVDLNMQDMTELRNTPLFYAVIGRHSKVMWELFAAGCDIRVRNTLGKTALDYVGSATEELQRPLEAFLSPSTGWKYYPAEVLITAVREGDVSSLCDLLKHENVRQCLNVRHPTYGMTPLMIASRCGRVRVVKILLRCGADVDLRADGDYGYTSLHFAVIDNQADVIDVLLESHANPHIRSHDGHTALDIARLNSRHRIIDLLNFKLRIRCGWMNYRTTSSLLQPWRKRWATLLWASMDCEHLELALFRDENTSHPELVLAIDRTQMQAQRISSGKWGGKTFLFEFSHPVQVFSPRSRSNRSPSSPKRLRFAVKDSIELDQWLTSINVAPSSCLSGSSSLSLYKQGSVDSKTSSESSVCCPATSFGASDLTLRAC